MTGYHLAEMTTTSADEADLIATAAGTFMIGTKLGTPAAPPAPAAAPPAGTETP